MVWSESQATTFRSIESITDRRTMLVNEMNSGKNKLVGTAFLNELVSELLRMTGTEQSRLCENHMPAKQEPEKKQRRTATL